MYFQTDLLNSLPERQQIFFTAVCVERVVQVYEFNYDNTILEPRNIVEALLNDLVTNKINATKLAEQKENLEDLIPDTEEMGSEFTPSMLAGVAILHLLNAVISNEKEELLKALGYTLEAVDSFSEYNQEGLEEEKSWQKQAMDIVKAAKGFPVDEIKKINEKYPQWSEMWRD